MTTSPNLALPYLMPAQAQKHVTHNEALRMLDAVVQLSVLDRGLTTAPSSPADGERYIVGAGSTGAWAGQDNAIGAYQDGAWSFYSPMVGWRAWVDDENILVVWDGSDWSQLSGSVNPASFVGVNTTADGTNRLSVSSIASLFSHEGTDHRVTINKAALANTASVVFQNGFSGRAEFGLTGDDNFHMKVSPDGSQFVDALVIDAATGVIGSPYSVTADANVIINGDFVLNQRSFAGGILSAGSYGHDRWKAGPGGATYTVSGAEVSLASGSMEQVIEAALWGHPNFDNSPVTVSVENPSADMTIGFGNASGTISGGSGRRSFSFSTGIGISPTPSLTLQSAGAGTVSFSKVMVTCSTFVSAWSARPLWNEHALASRYFQRLTKVNPGSGTQMFSLGSVSPGAFVGSFQLPHTMRTAPTLAYSALSDLQIIVPGSTGVQPSTLTLEDGDGAGVFGAKLLTVSSTHSGTASGAGYLGVAASQTASLDFDAEL